MISIKNLFHNIVVLSVYCTIYTAAGILFMITLGVLKHLIFGRWEW